VAADGRPPLLEEDPALVLAPVIARYQRALATGDLDGILGVFKPEGYVREPSGGSHVHRGRDGLRRFYAGLFALGALSLEHCAATDDGVACALEYNVVRWGGTPLPPQAGIAVYERGASGLLAAARMYDDVVVPSSLTAAS